MKDRPKKSDVIAGFRDANLVQRSIRYFDGGSGAMVLIFASSSFDERLYRMIEEAGFQVKIVESVSHLLTHDNANACALIVNLDTLNEKQRTRMEQLARQGNSLPVIAISSEYGLAERLIAIRMGATAFIETPVNCEDVVKELVALTERFSSDPYQVLVIDDQPSVMTFLKSTLEHHGFVVHGITDPAQQLMTFLQQHTPDLILLDLYMPGINGQELAGVIRQLDNLISVPMIFLSNELSSDVQIRAMCTGADAFLTKPVEEKALLYAVESRIRRGREVRNLVTRDPLSSLLNRREILRRLDEEVVRCQRYGNRLCLALLDLDHFKRVNDEFGHEMGDRVIRHFSMLLRDNLREGDIIGRQGGEEFLVVFPETVLPVAISVMERLATKLDANPVSEHLRYTFSAGLVRALPGIPAERLLHSADMALYQAKSEGRNRITCVSEEQAARSSA